MLFNFLRVHALIISVITNINNNNIIIIVCYYF